MDASAEYEDIRRRLAILTDEREVMRSLYAYGQAIDHGREEEWVDLFVEDGVFDARGRNPGDVTRVTRGREELARFAAHFSRPPTGWHEHLVIEPLIAVDGDSARVSSYFAVLRDDGDTPFVWAFGRYLDTLVRCADGRWRFAERIAEVESVDARFPSLAFQWAMP